MRLLGKLGCWHRLAARHAGDVGDDAFNLVNAPPPDVFTGGFGQFIGPFGHGISLI
jgi:hypothetical protein